MSNLRLWLLEALLWVFAASAWVWAFKKTYLDRTTPDDDSEWWRELLLGAFLWGVVAWIWAWSFEIFAESTATITKPLDLDSFFTALFGASSIALFILSLLVATLAVFGWQSIKEHIEERVTKAIDDRSKEVYAAIESRISRIDETLIDRTQTLENQLRGRVSTTLGYTIGEMSLKPGTFKVRDRDRLSDAVVHCKDGYQFLQKVGGPAEFLGLNNLVFYTCAFEDGMSKDNEEWMLDSARLLLDAGQKNNSNMLKLTACRVLLEYGGAQREKERAYNILKTIAGRKSPASERERKEARFYLTKYPESSSPIALSEAEDSTPPSSTE